MPIDDSWARDSGPNFLINQHGDITPRMLCEARHAGTGYLANYLKGVRAIGPG